MKVKIVRIEPTNQVSTTGKKKYYAYSDDGDRHIAWGDWIEATQGKEIDVTLKQESFKGSDYTVIWPAKEEARDSSEAHETTPVASEVGVRIRPKTSEEVETRINNIDKRERLMAKESALKSATQVWSAKVTAGLDGQGQEDPLDMAKRFYEWILKE